MTLKPDPTTAGYDNTIDGVPVNVVQNQDEVATNAVLTAVEDQTTHYLGVTDLTLNAAKDTIAHTIGVQVKGVRPAGGTV